MKITQLHEAKALDETLMCPQKRLLVISNTTGLSFPLKRIGPLAAIITALFYLLVFYLSAISKTSKNLSASVYSESLIKTASQHLLLLVGFDTLIYRKYCDTPPILVGHQSPSVRIADVADSSLFEVGDNVVATLRGLAAEDDASARFRTFREVNSSDRWPHGGRQLSWVCHGRCHMGWLNSGVSQAT